MYYPPGGPVGCSLPTTCTIIIFPSVLLYRLWNLTASTFDACVTIAVTNFPTVNTPVSGLSYIEMSSAFVPPTIFIMFPLRVVRALETSSFYHYNVDGRENWLGKLWKKRYQTNVLHCWWPHSLKLQMKNRIENGWLILKGPLSIFFVRRIRTGVFGKCQRK